MEVEEAVKMLGFFGRWQASIYFLITFSANVIPGLHLISIVWIGYTPPHHCKIPENSSVLDWIPSDAEGVLSSCFMYANSTNQTITCVDGWQFDEIESGPTIVTKWRLVCDRAYFVNLSQMLVTIGFSIGGFSMTRIADKFGRKWILVLNFFSMSFCSLLTVFSDRVELFLILRFFLGIFIGGTVLTQNVYLVECMTVDNRTILMTLHSAIWALGLAVQPLLAYIAASWIYLEIIFSLYAFAFLPFLVWWLPETIPWLYTNNYIEEAENHLLWAAKLNNVVMIRPILKPKSEDEDNEEMEEFEEDYGNNGRYTTEGKYQSFGINNPREFGFIEDIKNRFLNRRKTKKYNSRNQYSILELVRNRYLLRHMSFVLIYLIVDVGYYGISYTSASLSTNRFLSGFLNAVVEIPACIIIGIVVTKFGNKKPMILFFAVSALAMFSCILSVTCEKQNRNYFYVTLAFNVIFKFFISGAYAMIFIYAAQNFPTNLRQQALGICQGVGRIGAIASSYSSLIIKMYPRALYAFYGFLTLLGVLVIILLPETANRPLPETVEDVEAWYKEDANGKTETLEND